MKKKVVFERVLVAFIIISSFIVFSPIIAKAQAKRIDSECMKFFISNPNIDTRLADVSEDADKNGDFKIGIEEANDICTIEDDLGVVAQFASYQKCFEFNNVRCDYNTSYCLQLEDTAANNISYECVEKVVDASAKTNCAQCIGDVDKVCKKVAPILHYSYTANGLTSKADIWSCEDKEEFVNFFGVNWGPFNEAIPKLIRTILVGALAVIAMFSGITLFFALWKSTQRTQESFEELQKTVRNAILGLLFVIMGIFIIQFLSQIFGISGNIFEFNYTP